MSLEKNLEKLNNALSALIKNEDPVEGEVPDTIEMMPDEFLEYAAEQLEKCVTDTPEQKIERIESLKKNLEEVQKNFVGPTPGAVPITVYRDKDQKVPTKKEVTPSNASAATGFSSNVTSGDREVGKGPTGQLVSTSPAPGSGFESPNNASFAKAFELLTKALESFNKEEPKKEEPKGEVVKNDTIWPLDMNTSFGLGKSDKPDVLVWGEDGTESDPNGYEEGSVS
jgi:hypothetical protein